MELLSLFADFGLVGLVTFPPLDLDHSEGDRMGCYRASGVGYDCSKDGLR